MNQPEEKIDGTVSADSKDARTWAMFLHLSMLANFIVPIAGIVAPIVIWQIKKDEIPSIDSHGKNAVNWIISAVIYSFIGLVLMLVAIGFFLLLALAVVSVVFPVIAGIKANKGEVWKYPLSISFLK